jgi:hypothetical protein
MLAQVEAKMTVSKSIALWKQNAGYTIDFQLENQHKNQTLVRFALILQKHVKL